MTGVRKLAILSSGFALATALSHYLIPNEYLAVLSGIFAAASLLSFAFKGNIRLRCVLAAAGIASGFAVYALFCSEYLVPENELPEDYVTVSAQVTDFPQERSGARLIYVKLTDDDFPRVNGLLIEYAKDGKTIKLTPGDEIEVSVRFSDASKRYNEYTDLNISKGLYAVGYTNGEAEITGHWDKSWIYFPKYLAKSMQSRVSEIFADDVSPFMLALLTGDKSEYYNDDALNYSMGISGLAHVVAVSGMHIAFLLGFLYLVFGKNKLSSFICIIIVWIFVLMVGAPPSAVRAGIMQTFLLTAPIFGRENDAITSLSFALALLLAVNPFAIGSVSLQLSFAAMAGIVFFAQPIYDGIKKKLNTKSRFADYIIGIFSSSVSVAVLTIPLIAVHFGYISLLSIAANILCSWAISLAFCGGIISCTVSVLSVTAAEAAAWCIAWLVRYIAFVAEKIAAFPMAAIYIENKTVLCWLIFSYVIFAFCLFFDKRKKHVLPAIAVSAASLVFVLLLTHFSMVNDGGTMTVYDVGNGQCISFTEGSASVIVDCGSSGSFLNAGTEVSNDLKSRGRCVVDCLVLTHIHSDHAKGVERLLNAMDVKLLIMPYNAPENDEDGLYDCITEAAQRRGTEIKFISRDENLSFGGISLKLYAPSDVGEKNERGVLLSVGIGENDILITGDVSSSVEKRLAEKADLSDTDILIVGHHGSKTSTCQELLSAALPETAIISTGYNSYGHPTNAVLRRLEAFNVDIYRTDLHGEIVIRFP